MRPVVSTYGEEALDSAVTLDVLRPDLERHFLAQDKTALSAIAEASGGRYLTIDQTDALPEELAAEFRRRTLTSEYSPCRHWAYYTVLALALASAWLIRKRSGLA